MPSISLPWATFFYNVSSVALVSGAVVVLAGTIGNVWMGSVKERYGDDRIAANEAETARANEAAAKANVRAAEITLELEQERTARLVIEERVQNQGEQVSKLMPRRLDDAQRLKLSELLPGLKSSISVGHDIAASDSKAISNEIANIFQSSGWQVSTPGIMGIGNPPTTGLAFRVSKVDALTPFEKYVARALSSAGIQFDLQPGRTTRPEGYYPSPDIRGVPIDMFPEVELIFSTKLR